MNKSQKRQEEDSKYIREPIKTVNGQVKIKKYLKIKEVGSGSYSNCYLVRNIDSQSTYVVKVIPKNKLQILNKQKLFYEIKIHQSLSHKNIVHLDHWFEDETHQYIFLEYCSKGNLEMKLEKVKKFSEKEIKVYVRQIVEGIQYLHSQKILHRDLKLCNFYIDEFDSIKLGDFGFACQLSHENDKKRQTCGTPNYIAPEAISGFGYSFSSDIWAIGVILFRLKFNFCPFEGETVKITLENVKCCNYFFPKGAKISSQLKDLIEKIFNLNYDDRLTTEEILNHPFFDGTEKIIYDKRKKEEVQPKRKFSLTKLFTGQSQETKETKRKGIMEKETRTQTKKEEPKRSNSCQSFKEIKQIFKNKSQKTMTTQSDRKTEGNSLHSQFIENTLSTNRDGRIGSKASKTIIQMSMTQNFYDFKEEGTRKSKLNQFIKSKVMPMDNRAELKKMSRKNQNLIVTNDQKTNQNATLSTYRKKCYLPTEVQVEKDIVIIHYRASVKQLIHANVCYTIYKNVHNIYDMKGQKMNSLPKICKYIIENKVKVCQYENDQIQPEQIPFSRILLLLPSNWVQVKEGIILKYKNFSVNKLYSQEAFYISEDKTSLMYNVVEGVQKVWEGIVVMRVYSGWVKSVQNHVQKIK